MPPDNEPLLPDLPPPERSARLGLRAPPDYLKWFEVRALLETALLVPTAPLLALRPRGDGRPVMVIPGFMTDDRSTLPLRLYLRFLGYRPLPWELGRNKGMPERDAEVLAGRIRENPPDQPLTLIGWSLGGVIARELARLEPAIVREIITLGTPVEGGPKYTVAARAYARRARLDLDEFEVHVHNVNRRGVGVPMTAIYSKSDGIVGWRASIDRYNEQTRHRRVPGSHLGLGTNPLVWHIIERTLRSGR